MFLGHFALGMAAKKLDAEVSLATTFLAARLPDLVWPLLVLAGAEHVAIAPGDTAVTPLRFESYPYSHSLLAAGLWAAAVAVIHFLSRHLANLFGPPPPSPTAVALAGLLGAILLLPWAAWADR